MPASDIGIDLGTRNSLVYSTGKGLVLNEPSIVVYDKNTEKIRAIGEEARMMEERITSDMEIIRPIRQGVIVDYTVMEKMLKYFISRAREGSAFRKPRISICVPSGITEIERKAVEEATYQAGARDVFMVEEPIAAAIGSGVDVTKPFGNLIVDIGAGTTDVAVISLGGVVVSTSLKTAGDTFDQAIMNYVRKNHGLFIGEDRAEKIKVQIGTACEESAPRTMEVKGRNVITGLPEGSNTYIRRNPCGIERCYRTDRGSRPRSSGENTSGTGSRYRRPGNCSDRRWCTAPWNGYTDRAENGGKHTDSAGCDECGCHRNGQICGDHVQI